jgi:hypothetical protein
MSRQLIRPRSGGFPACPRRAIVRPEADGLRMSIESNGAQDRQEAPENRSVEMVHRFFKWLT